MELGNEFRLFGIKYEFLINSYYYEINFYFFYLGDSIIYVEWNERGVINYYFVYYVRVVVLIYFE